MTRLVCIPFKNQQGITPASADDKTVSPSSHDSNVINWCVKLLTPLSSLIAYSQGFQ